MRRTAVKKTPLYHICEHHSPNKKLVKLLLLKNGGHFETRDRPRMQDVRLAKVRKLLDEEEKHKEANLFLLIQSARWQHRSMRVQDDETSVHDKTMEMGVTKSSRVRCGY